MYIRPYRGGHRVEVEKHGVRATHLAKTKREARDWGLRKEAELEAQKGKRGDLLSAAITRYLETVSPTKGTKAVVWETHRFAAMQEFFGEHAVLAEIDSERIGEWRDWRLKGDKDHPKVSGSTVRRESNLLRNLFTIAADEWGWIEKNPFKGVRLPKHNPARKKVWRWQLIRRVLRAPVGGKTLETVHAFHIALHTAMRLNEVLAAQPKGPIAVLPKDKVTQDEEVKVPLPRKGAQLMAKYGGKFTVDANEASALFSELTDSLGIEGLTFHDSRATACTLLARRVDILTLSKISRHKNLKTLQIYYRETPEEIAARITKR